MALSWKNMARLLRQALRQAPRQCHGNPHGSPHGNPHDKRHCKGQLQRQRARPTVCYEHSTASPTVISMTSPTATHCNINGNLHGKPPRLARPWLGQGLQLASTDLHLHKYLLVRVDYERLGGIRIAGGPPADPTEGKFPFCTLQVGAGYQM